MLPVPRLSIIIPVFNEADIIADCLEALSPLRARGVEVSVADGGSTDETVAIATARADRVVRAARGRALQMNAGAALAAGEILVFLHADCRLPEDADSLILDALGAGAADWGRFDVELVGRHALLPVIAWFMNRRSRLTGIATGDQAIFVRRALFRDVGGYPPIALMEDIGLGRILRKRGRPLCLAAKVRASGRRWDEQGAWRTVVLMWWLRLSYFLGADPGRLARRYGSRDRAIGR